MSTEDDRMTHIREQAKRELDRRRSLRVAGPEDAQALRPEGTLLFMLAALRDPERSRPILDDRPLRHNQLSNRDMLGDKYLDDHDVTLIRERFQALEKAVTQEGVKTIRYSKDDMFSAVQLVAKENSFHPIRDWLHSLKWDGVERLDDAMSTYFGQSDPLQAIYFRRWMVAAIARAMKPGCQAENMLILTGPQGSFKTSFFRELAKEEWFASTQLDPSREDSWEALQGKWLLEWAELESMLKSRTMEAVKGFMSVQIDHKRKKYGRISEDFPRQCVFGGTTNRADFLTDETGHRRFWVVQTCKPADIALLRAQREQLWAEALHLYEAGEQWWLTPSEQLGHASASEDYAPENPWLERVANYLVGRVQVPMQDVMDALEIPVERQNRRDLVNAISATLRACGWHNRERARTEDGKRPRIWTKESSQASIPL